MGEPIEQGIWSPAELGLISISTPPEFLDASHLSLLELEKKNEWRCLPGSPVPGHLCRVDTHFKEREKRARYSVIQCLFSAMNRPIG